MNFYMWHTFLLTILIIFNSYAYGQLDSLIYDEDILTQTSEANAKFETEKKEREIAEQQLTIQQQKNTRNAILFSGILLITLMGGTAQYFVSRQKRLKQEAELALTLEQQRSADLEELSRIRIGSSQRIQNGHR